jgi:hypothetical protein
MTAFCHEPAGRWLALLRMLLEPIGVPCNITAGGTLTRKNGQERIEFLAAARNALLPPVGPQTSIGAEKAYSAGGGNGSSADNMSYAPHLQASAPQWPPNGGAFIASDVLFVNDIYFCAGDALRMLWLDADFVAGFDFGAVDNTGSPGRRRLVQHGNRFGNSSSAPLSVVEHAVGQVQRGQRRLQVHGGGPSNARGVNSGTSGALRRMLGYEQFSFARVLDIAAAQGGNSTKAAYVRFYPYDVWVWRDISGQRLRWSPPFGNTPNTTSNLARGAPFPVYCGWGGMVRVTAQPFADGLRFRKNLEGECAARCVAARLGTAGCHTSSTAAACTSLLLTGCNAGKQLHACVARIWTRYGL